MMYAPSLVQPHHQHLVSQLEHLGAIRSPTLRAAFAAIPRHAFLSHYYEHQAQTGSWYKRVAPEPTSDPNTIEAWLTAVYENKARTTVLDANQNPSSSSSQPSVMAQMLEALEVERGMRVLEIGTGTGYNAALLAHLTGNAALVTTIDIQAHLVRDATQVIEHLVGPGLVAQVGDGYTLTEDTCYERLIATAKAATVPESWISQLVAGGRLVMNLGGHLAGGLLVAHKEDDGSMQGSFLPTNLSFMPMHSPAQPSLPLFRHMAQHAITQVSTVDASEFSPLVFQQRDFRFFLQWVCPTAVLEWWGEDQSTLLPVLFEQETLLTFVREPESTSWSIQTRGSAPLWYQVFQAYQAWRQARSPTVCDYRLSISQKPYQKQLILSSTGKQGTEHTFQLA